MKTIKFMLIALALLSSLSCDTYYRMVVSVDRNGGVVRDVYALADSAFLKGDTSKNPFLFYTDSCWTVTPLDTVVVHDFFGKKERLNTKATWKAPSIDRYAKEVRYDAPNRSWAMPEESLSQKNGWFYTRYTFTACYKKMAYEAPVPIGNYLTPEEQKLWTQGGWSRYAALNGAELNELLNGMERKFMQWYSRNLFEISLGIIEKKAEGHTVLDSDKDNLFKWIESKNKNDEINPALVCSALDAFYGTTYFTGLHKAGKEAMDKEFEQAISVVNLLGAVFSYELEVPGRVLDANAAAIENNRLVWKVDGMRILLDDYILTAEYRLANNWAFAVTGVVILAAAACLILLVKQRRRRVKSERGN